MKFRVSIILLVLYISYPIKAFSQDWIRILEKATKVTATALEVAQWIEIASVIIASEDDLEYWLNQQVNYQIQRNNVFYTSDWLTNMGNRLAAKSMRPHLPKGLSYHFYIIKADNFNAFAVPGGSVYVTSALFETLNEEEMAFVLGHEIAHVSYKHSVKLAKASHTFIAIEKIALKLLKEDREIKQLLDLLATGVYTTVLAGYSREWERDADKYGCYLAYLANYHPQGSLNALRKIANATHSWSSSCFLWDTHPAMTERIQLLNAQISMLDMEKFDERPLIEDHFAFNNSTIEPDHMPGNSLLPKGFSFDPESNYSWDSYTDNPSSMLRYLMDVEDNTRRLPEFKELEKFFVKLVTGLNNSDQRIAVKPDWLCEGNYISSTYVQSKNLKKYYKGIYWNPSTGKYKIVYLAPGDLVNIILIHQ